MMMMNRENWKKKEFFLKEIKLFRNITPKTLFLIGQNTKQTGLYNQQHSSNLLIFLIDF